MSGQLIVITGVSGHVGFRVLVDALSRGYSVRAVIRKAEQAELIKRPRSIHPFLAKLEIVVVPDLLAQSAFDEVLKGASGVVHVASPLPVESDNLRRDVVDPAVTATLRILESAAKVPSVKRVVITSSIATVITFEYLASDDVTTVFHAQDTYTPPGPEAQFSSSFEAYVASKALALQATKQFVEKEKPSFDVINIMPSTVLGRNELTTKKEEFANGTNNFVLGPLLGTKTTMPGLGSTVHVNDVAKAHVDALNPSVPGNRDFITASGGLDGIVWDDVKDIARRHFPKAVSEGILTLDVLNMWQKEAIRSC